jgi:hypothetical protein
LLSPVVGLGKSALDLLHPSADRDRNFASDQKVCVVGSQAIAKNLDLELFQALPEYLAIAIAVLSKLEEELAIMTPMSQVINAAG